MRISLVQISSDDNKEGNFKKTRELIVTASARGSDIICLPECFLYHGNKQEDKVERLPSAYIEAFQDIARKESVNIILGSIIVLDDSEKKPRNISFILNRNGEIVHRYSKQYMYDVQRQDFSYHESGMVEPGTDSGLFELDGVTMGVGICVDVRYPEYFRELTRGGAEVIFLPSSFRVATGLRAWDVLTKARAIENQLYFCACGQTGGEGASARVGNSRIISYDGEMLCEAGEEEGVFSADIDLEKLRAFRSEFPVLKQVRKY